MPCRIWSGDIAEVLLRHCEERSDEAIQEDQAQAFDPVPLDCFASLAMTGLLQAAAQTDSIFVFSVCALNGLTM